MAKKIIKAQMQQRQDTKANWASVNPVLLDGELGMVSDDRNLYKVGDGRTAWNDLPFRGFDGTLAQELGTSPNAAISQKAVTEKFEEIESELNKPEGIDPSELDKKQDKLVSGENIKTINGRSILGEGNLTIQGGNGSYDDTEIWVELSKKADKTYVDNAIAQAITLTLNTEV